LVLRPADKRALPRLKYIYFARRKIIFDSAPPFLLKSLSKLTGIDFETITRADEIIAFACEKAPACVSFDLTGDLKTIL